LNNGKTHKRFLSFNIAYSFGRYTHFPFNLPLLVDLCQHIKKQLSSANLRPIFLT
jgi:hypothetical protein